MVCREILQLGLSLPEVKHRGAASLRVRMAKIAYLADVKTRRNLKQRASRFSFPNSS
jgi:hypothetical protein